MFRKLGMFDRSLGMFQPSKFVQSELPWVSPASLFTNGEQGVWYDPSDFSTMFQDSAGTTPVTAIEQPVGLLLDKSKGLVLGPELVTNGTFDSDTAWSKGGTWTISAGAANAGGSSGSLTQSISFSTNTTYIVSYTVVSISSGNIKVQFQGGSAIVGALHSAPGTYTEYLNAANNNTVAVVVGGTTPNAVIDNISVRELPGYHALQSSSTVRPTYRTAPDRLYFDADPDSLTITFPSAPGNSTVAYGVAGGAPVITYPVNISGTTYTMNPTNTGSNNTGLVIVNRQLTAPETVNLAAYLRSRS